MFGEIPAKIFRNPKIYLLLHLCIVCPEVQPWGSLNELEPALVEMERHAKVRFDICKYVVQGFSKFALLENVIQIITWLRKLKFCKLR